MSEPENLLPRGEAILAALQVACQAPSLHNSQPWRWVVDGHRVRLYEDLTRLLPFTDAFGRQTVMSCGAALHHARVAFAALGWATTVQLFPSESDPYHLATLEVTARHKPTARDVAWAVAISRRWSNRQPFAAPMDAELMEPELREAVAEYGVSLAILRPADRTTLAEATGRGAPARRYDTTLVDELRWWAGPTAAAVRAAAVGSLSAVHHGTAGLDRYFLAEERISPSTPPPPDHSTILILATAQDSLADWLHCGEALSAALLTCTAHGLATCPLSHLTELPESRALIAELAPDKTVPQVLVRTGVAMDDRPVALTERLPLAEVVTVLDDAPAWTPLHAVTLRDRRRAMSPAADRND